MLRKVAILLLATPIAWAAQDDNRAAIQVHEQAIETSTAEVRVPASLPSSMLVRPCGTCPARQVQLNATTRYVIAGEDVSAQQFTRHIVQNGTLDLVIFFDSASSQVTRLVAARGRAATR